jgi:hypothetical protein
MKGTDEVLWEGPGLHAEVTNLETAGKRRLTLG